MRVENTSPCLPVSKSFNKPIDHSSVVFLNVPLRVQRLSCPSLEEKVAVGSKGKN